jgi:hypothetical protein
MNLADAIHELAVAGCRLTAAPDGGIALDVPPGATVARQVLDVLRAHRQELAAVAAPAPPPVSDLADYLSSKGITGSAAELVLRAAQTFEIRHDRITVEAEAAEPSPVFFEPGIPALTTTETEWHVAGRGLVTIPAGTLGLLIPQVWAIADDGERVGIEGMLESLRRHRKPPHVPVWLEGKARAIETNLITFEGAVAPDGMNLLPWRP